MQGIIRQAIPALITLVLFIVFGTGCGIQKRHYRPGFYLSRSKSLPDPGQHQQAQQPTSQKSTATAPHATVAEVPDHETAVGLQRTFLPKVLPVHRRADKAIACANSSCGHIAHHLIRAETRKIAVADPAQSETPVHKRGLTFALVSLGCLILMVLAVIISAKFLIFLALFGYTVFLLLGLIFSVIELSGPKTSPNSEKTRTFGAWGLSISLINVLVLALLVLVVLAFAWGD